jgi:hypothetical protein
MSQRKKIPITFHAVPKFDSDQRYTAEKQWRYAELFEDFRRLAVRNCRQRTTS